MSNFLKQNEVNQQLGPLTKKVAPYRQTGFSENAQAAWDATARSSVSMSGYLNRLDAYNDRIDEIERVTGERLQNPMGTWKWTDILPVKGAAKIASRGFGLVPGTEKITNVLDAVPETEELFRIANVSKFEQRVRELRKQHPNLETYQGMKDRIKDRVQNSENKFLETSAKSDFSGAVGSFVGAAGPIMMDPPVALSMFAAPASGASLLQVAIHEAKIAAGAELLIQPKVQSYRSQQGLEAGVAEGALNVGVAAVGGAVIGGAAKSVELYGSDLLKQFRKDVKNPTAEQQFTAEAYEDYLEAASQNPFDGKGARQTHQKRIKDTLDSLNNNQLPEQGGNLENAPAIKYELNQDNLDGLIFGFNPDDIDVDAKTFQFKDGGDKYGVTERLQGVTKWDPVKAGQIIVFEDSAGKRFIADGHQRLGLAKRLKAEGNQDVKLYGQLFREEDGFTPASIRVAAAIKNIAEGTGTAIDAAKVLRVSPDRIKELPPRSSLVRQANDLINLSDEAFGMVVNEIVPANYAAIVGRLVPNDEAVQKAVLDVLAKTDPSNMTQAEAIARQALDAGVSRQTQQGLFGEEIITESLFSERAKVLDRTIKQLKNDKRVFETLTKNQNRIEAEGNILNRESNLTKAELDQRAMAMIQILANRKGALSDALSNAARRAKNEGTFKSATDEFITAVRRSAERGDFDGIEVGGIGRYDQASDEGSAIAATPEQSRDEQTINLFDEPGGSGSENQGNSIKSQIDQELELSESDGFLDEEIPMFEKIDPETGETITETKTARQILEDLDADEADLDAIGKCEL